MKIKTKQPLPPAAAMAVAEAIMIEDQHVLKALAVHDKEANAQMNVAREVARERRRALRRLAR